MIGRPSTRRALVVYCHPVEASFTTAARDRVVAGLTTADRDIRLRDLYAEQWETEGDVAAHAADLVWCDTLVLVYPTWWAGQPGILSDWIVRMWPEEAQRRNIRRLVAVSSHGSPKYVNALEGEVGKHLLGRWVRRRCHPLTRLEWLPFYDIDTSADTDRAAYLARIEQRFATRY